MPDDVNVTVVALELEIPVIRGQPAVEDLEHADAAVVDDERSWCFLATMTGVTLDAQLHTQ